MKSFRMVFSLFLNSETLSGLNFRPIISSSYVTPIAGSDFSTTLFRALVFTFKGGTVSSGAQSPNKLRTSVIPSSTILVW